VRLKISQFNFKKNSLVFFVQKAVVDFIKGSNLMKHLDCYPQETIFEKKYNKFNGIFEF